MNDLPNTINYNVLDMVFRSWLCNDRCFSEAAGSDINCRAQVMHVQPA